MKSGLALSLAVITVAAVVTNSQSPSGLQTTRFAAAAPPLSLEGLLDEKLPAADTKKEKLAVDNSACYVCHGTLDTEPLVVTHGKAEVSCVDCHGKSLAHRNDEDNAIPPDKMYTLNQVDTMCAKCHHEHDVSARKILRRWKERCPEKTVPNSVVCTDCHFDHRIKRRTVQWNKKTGELLIRKHVPQSDTTPNGTGRQGRQPTSSYRSEPQGPLPLVAQLCKTLNDV